MKKFLAVLLPIILIGSLMSTVFVAAQPACVPDYTDRTPWRPISTLPNYDYQDHDADLATRFLLSGRNLRYTHTGRYHQDGNIEIWGFVGELEGTGTFTWAWVDRFGNPACGTNDQVWVEVWHPWYTQNNYQGVRTNTLWFFWHFGVTPIAWLNADGAWEW